MGRENLKLFLSFSLFMYDKSNEVVKGFHDHLFTGSCGTVFHGLWFGSVCHILFRIL